ncbi:MAG: hypothetical protein LAT68_06310 [Cyclobacteriaceae bacterium]|nr:hypothetical protein [Cyclobacteriaceae bacterium]MCH8515923.1 hypothetical protein [Cyclobacteriaceae bacterium]
MKLADLNNKKKLTTKWLVFSISGLILLGAGLCFFGNALINFQNGDEWFWSGTFALVVFNSGVSVIGRGINYRSHLDRLSAN